MHEHLQLEYLNIYQPDVSLFFFFQLIYNKHSPDINSAFENYPRLSSASSSTGTSF